MKWSALVLESNRRDVLLLTYDRREKSLSRSSIPTGELLTPFAVDLVFHIGEWSAGGQQERSIVPSSGRGLEGGCGRDEIQVGSNDETTCGDRFLDRTGNWRRQLGFKPKRELNA